MNEKAVRLAPFLWIFYFTFVLRVLGQLLVACGFQGPLPPMKEWFSGLTPYPSLLVSQIIIVIILGKICLDFSRGGGFFVTPRRGFGKGLLIFGFVYLAVMILRYILRMTFHPEARWFGGTIPIFLHWVLATFLIIVGNFHWKNSRQ